LVEVGVGLIPAWGGCKEMLLRHMGEKSAPGGLLGGLMATGGAMPVIKNVFEMIATAKVSGSAEEAKDLKILREDDAISMNRARVLMDAKLRCIEMAKTYKAPEQAVLHLPGKTARVALSMAVDGFAAIGKATPHDVVICKRLAHVLAGGDTDISEPITEQDQRVLTMVIEAGRALVLAFNKWDLVDEDRRFLLDREIDLQLAQLPWAPRVNISAKTGRALQKLVPAMETALNSWDMRISTGQLNAWLKEIIAATPPPVRGGKQPRILFATQATARPPTFVLFSTGFLEAGYRRFLERRLRETFGFEGTPIRINVRVREKRKTKPR
jgi:GTP-binding protein